MKLKYMPIAWLCVAAAFVVLVSASIKVEMTDFIENPGILELRDRVLPVGADVAQVAIEPGGYYLISLGGQVNELTKWYFIYPDETRSKELVVPAITPAGTFEAVIKNSTAANTAKLRMEAVDSIPSDSQFQKIAISKMSRSYYVWRDGIRWSGQVATYIFWAGLVFFYMTNRAYFRQES